MITGILTNHIGRFECSTSDSTPVAAINVSPSGSRSRLVREVHCEGFVSSPSISFQARFCRRSTFREVLIICRGIALGNIESWQREFYPRRLSVLGVASTHGIEAENHGINESRGVSEFPFGRSRSTRVPTQPFYVCLNANIRWAMMNLASITIYRGCIKTCRGHWHGCQELEGSINNP
ncbi:hypothetical protein P170DRAFT_125535 [Aspergillus steynii IBT 23096]|uniref:Uncharacterized protein n=1 Tax=Aspergillus steynii IBT 23096 TaxID=1392250 RepID=A0A2I2GK10_9EURO|nr:uncharacterized protein P170DRAFT_125535 [Aspergillus steynii IBT 23096]PLB53211.1 hypothetical protein P170DRAFT_125535 [Aspergillus steynii IBT 23096]